MAVRNYGASVFGQRRPSPSQLPVAKFTASPLTGDDTTVFVFTNQSKHNPTNYLYNFGDGNTSTSANTTHSYTSTGVYTVSLHVSNQHGQSTNTRTNYISVNVVPPPPPPPPAPVANFSGTPLTGTAPLLVAFTDLSTNSPTSWGWTFGDNTTSSLQNPSHLYAAAGSYTVSLSAANSGGQSPPVTRTDYVTATSPPPPTGSFLTRTQTRALRLALPFAMGQLAIDWTAGAHGRAYVLMNYQVDEVVNGVTVPRGCAVVFDLPSSWGTGTDPNAWPLVNPTSVVARWYDLSSDPINSDSSVYAGLYVDAGNTLGAGAGKLWGSPKKYYMTTGVNPFTLVATSGESIAVPRERQAFGGGWLKRFGQAPILMAGGPESGQNSAYGVTACELDGTVHKFFPFAGTWDEREIRDKNYFPLNHIDFFAALDPANHPSDPNGRWALDRIYSGGILWQGKAYINAVQGTGVIDYNLQGNPPPGGETFSNTQSNCWFEYDTANWSANPNYTTYQPAYGDAVVGIEYGAAGDSYVLCYRNAHTSDRYQVDPALVEYGPG